MKEEQVQSGILDRRGDIIVPALIALATFIVFSGALRNGFLNWDDEVSILTNPHCRGLGWANLRWMFTTLMGGHYQPLVWLTFAADYLVWGMDPFGYHLTNVLLHAANAVFFYYVASLFLSGPANPRGLPAGIGAALAALFFAVHPLRVESVAWVTERKDVLSGFFYLGAVYSYLRRHANGDSPGRGWQALCWISFALALLAKSIVITLPAVFIILDFYPLRRLPGDVRQWFTVVWLEKLPFLVPAVLFALVEYVGERRLGTILTENAAAHCARAAFGLTFYFWKTFWPVHLCPLYEPPIPFDPFAGPFLVSAAAVALITAGFILARRHWPAGLTAWACYAITLAPVLGLVSFGSQLVADRYSYLACMPWPLLAAAGFYRLWGRARAWARGALGLGAALALAALAGQAWRQVGVWRDSASLWGHVLALRPDCAIARDNLAAVYNNLGVAMTAGGRFEAAEARYREAVRLQPGLPEIHRNWGDLLSTQGHTAEAAARYREALRLRPGYAEARLGLGIALAREGRLDAATGEFREALRLQPDNAAAHADLGIALASLGRPAQARLELEAALRLAPGLVTARENLNILNR